MADIIEMDLKAPAETAPEVKTEVKAEAKAETKAEVKATAKTETAVAKQEEPGAVALPSYLQAFAGQGSEDIPSDVIKPGRLNLMQGLSEQVADRLANIGDYYDTNLGKNMGETCEIIIVKQKAGWIKFPKKKDDDTETRAEDLPKCMKSADGLFWDDGAPLSAEEKWKTKAYDFYVLHKGEKFGIPSILSFGGMSTKAGAAALNLLARWTNPMMNNEPIFARTWKLSAEQGKNEKGTFQVKKLTPVDGYNTEAEVQFAAAIRAMLNQAEADGTLDTSEESRPDDIQVTEDDVPGMD